MLSPPSPPGWPPGGAPRGLGLLYWSLPVPAAPPCPLAPRIPQEPGGWAVRRCHSQGNSVGFLEMHWGTVQGAPLERGVRRAGAQRRVGPTCSGVCRWVSRNGPSEWRRLLPAPAGPRVAPQSHTAPLLVGGLPAGQAPRTAALGSGSRANRAAGLDCARIQFPPRRCWLWGFPAREAQVPGAGGQTAGEFLDQGACGHPESESGNLRRHRSLSTLSPLKQLRGHF